MQYKISKSAQKNCFILDTGEIMYQNLAIYTITSSDKMASKSGALLFLWAVGSPRGMSKNKVSLPKRNTTISQELHADR